MATARAVMNKLASIMAPVVAGIQVSGQSAPVTFGIGWPSTNKIQDVPKASAGVFTSLCGIFDRGAGNNTTRWPVIAAVPDVVGACGLVCDLVDNSPLLTTATLTLTGSPNTNDTVVFQYGNGVVLSPGYLESTALVGYKALVSDTLATFATALAAAISTIAGLTAVSSGGVISITSTNAPTYAVANAANQSVRTNEYNRLNRHLAVTFWCPSELHRQALTDPIESFLVQTRSSYGFQLANGEWVRLMYERDAYIDDAQLQSIFRRDFFMECEYGLTGSVLAYPILGASEGLQFNTAS